MYGNAPERLVGPSSDVIYISLSDLFLQTFRFQLPYSQQTQPLIKLAKGQIAEAISGPISSELATPCGPSLFLSLSSAIPSGEQASVCHGTLAGNTPVVVKLYEASSFDALMREVDAYQHLSSASLDFVPRCLGAFAPSHCAWAALVLEDKGESLGKSWQDLSLEDR